MTREKLYAIPKNTGNLKLNKEDFDSLYTIVLDNPLVFGIPTTRYYKVPLDMVKRYNPEYNLGEGLDNLYYTKLNDDPNDYNLSPVLINSKEGSTMVDIIQDAQERELYDKLGYKELPEITVTANGTLNNIKNKDNEQLTRLGYNNTILKSTGTNNTTNILLDSGINYVLPLFYMNPDDYRYQWQYNPFDNVNYNLEETKPLTKIDIQLEAEKERIRKNYDLFSFLSHISSRNNNDELLKELMLSKNYYDTPKSSIDLLNFGLNNTANLFNVLQQILDLATPTITKEKINENKNGGKINIYSFGDWITRPLQQLRNSIKLLQNNKLLNNRLLHLLASQPKNLTYTAPASSTRVESRREKGLLPIHRNLQKQLAVATAKVRNFMRYGHADADPLEIKKAELNPDTYLHDEVQPVIHTYIGPDNRTQQERVLGLQRFNNYITNLPEIRAKELLDYGTDKVLSTFMPSKHISAISRDGNYFSNLYADDNAGIWDLALNHDLAVQFSKDHPIISLAGNLATDWAVGAKTARGINNLRSIELPKFSYNNYAVSPIFARTMKLLLRLDEIKNLKNATKKVKLNLTDTSIKSANGRQYLIEEKPITNKDLENILQKIYNNKIYKGNQRTVNDEGYIEALKKGNLDEANYILQYNYNNKAKQSRIIDSNGEPKEFIHTVADQYDPNFTEFNATVANRPVDRAIYTVDPEGVLMSDAYADLRGVNDLEAYTKMSKHVNKLFSQNNTLNQIYTALQQGDQMLALIMFNKLPIYQRSLLKNSFERLMNKVSNTTTNFKFNMNREQLVNPKIRKHFWGNAENILSIDAKGRPWHNIKIETKPGTYETYTTNLIERDLMPILDSDLAIIKDVKDYGIGTLKENFWQNKMDPHNVYIFKSPNLLKSNNIITFDQQGDIILPSQRFDYGNKNFNFKNGGRINTYRNKTD